MRAFAHSLVFSGVVMLSGQALMVQASPHQAGPCTGRLQSLGYTRVKLDAAQAHASLYEARRGAQEVKLMVDNGSCMIRQTWLDD
jgi:hypothetical protein